MAKRKTVQLSALAKDIRSGLQETIRLVQGKPTRGRVSLVSRGQAIDIREIRTKLGMTRNEFAVAFFFKRKTVQNWEQGIRRPTEHTLAYLQLIAADPQGVYKQLHTKAS